jgi:proline-rich tail region repeat protein
MSLLKITAIALMCLGAAACGRKGPLEAPPQATAPAPVKAVSPQAPDAKPTVDVPAQPASP